MKRILVILLACCCLLTGCGRDENTSPDSPTPPATAENASMRGVWLSFLELSPLLKGATNPAEARAQIAAAMETCAAAGLNTVFFHARSHSDAYYISAVYPAAAAAAPLLAQGFDPLACAVEEAHKRNMALHAWVNPYRIGEQNTAPDNTGVFCHDGVYYHDPGNAAARQRVLAGVREILQHYAVDGIHFDDYFYPAGLSATGEDFEAIPAGMDVGDWRRAQVNGLVSAVYGLARQQGKTFGISPMGSIPKCREEAYADVALWAATPGYVDYLCPQLYYGFAHETAPFSAMLASWLALQRQAGCALYGGLALYKAGLADDPYAGTGRREWAAATDILARQAVALEESGTDGYVLFRYAHLTAETAAAERVNLFSVKEVSR